MVRDLRLNSTRHNDQARPTVATLDGGGVVAVWEDNAQDPGPQGRNGIYGRVFADNGRARGPEFRIPGETDGNQSAPRVAALKDGGFAVAWMSNGPDRHGTDDGWLDAYVRFFDKDGSPRGRAREIVGGDHLDHRIQDLAVLADGSVVAVTASSNVDTDWRVEAWRFDADGARQGRSVIDSKAYTGNAQIYRTETPAVDIAPLSDGGYLAAWWEERPPVQGVHQPGRVLDRRFDADGTARGPAHVATDDSRLASEYPHVAALPGGKVAVAWTADENGQLVAPLDVFFRVLGKNGAPITPERRVNAGDRAEDQIAEDVTHLGRGVTLVTYRSYDVHNSDSGNDYFGINGRLFGSDGRPLSPAFGISANAYEDIENAEVTLLNSGKLFVAWSGGGTLEKDVHARVLDLGTTIRGTAHGDRITGSPLAEKILGGGGRDTLKGAGGNDRLFGGRGDDRLAGGQGNDRLSGGPGDDVLRGGAGRDVFVFDQHAGRDRVMNIQGNDRVDVRAFDLPGRLPKHALTEVRDDVRLDLGQDTMVFKHADIGDLDGVFLF